MELLSTFLSEQTIRQIGWVLVHFLWQGLAAAAIMWAVLKVLGKSRAGVRYLAACIGMLLMTLAPAITFVAVQDPTAPPPAVERAAEPAAATIDAAPVNMIVITGETASEPAKKPLPAVLMEKLETALPWCVIGWAAGVAALSLWYLGGWCQLQKLRMIGTRPVSERIAAQTAELAQRLGITRAVRISESVLVQVPTMLGWLKPVILLPATALTGLDEVQLRAMIAHELAHIRRHDYLVNILQTAIEILGFYHPAVWWMSRQVRIERENCCDDMAAELVQDRTAYAKALFSMEEIRIQQLSLAMHASGGSLIDRIGRLVGKHETENSKAGWIPSIAASVILLAIIVSVASAVKHEPVINPHNMANKEQIENFLNDFQKAVQKGNEREIQQFFYFKDDSTRQKTQPFINILQDEFEQFNDFRIVIIERNPGERLMVTGLLPIDHGYTVGHLPMIFDKGTYKFDLFDGHFFSNMKMAISMSAKEVGRRKLQESIEELKNAGREELEKIIQASIERQQNLLAVIQYAQENQLRLLPHLNEAEINKTIKRFESTSPEQLRHEWITEYQSMLSKDGSGNNKATQVQHYPVNRMVAEFPQAEDFSTPESAYAAINRVMASGSREGWIRVSTKANAQRIAQSMQQDQQVPLEWAKVVLNARILEVRMQGDRAMVIAEFPQELSTKKIVNPIDARSLKLEDGHWLNAGQDRFDTVEEAAQKFGALVEREDRTEAAYRTALDQPAKFKQMAEELFSKLRNADFEQILSFYDTYSGHWRQDGWQRLGLNYTVHTDWPSFAAWVCRTFRDNPIVSVELNDAILSKKEFDGHKAPAVPYKLTLQDGSILQGELYFAYRASSGTWQPAEGIDWHLQEEPINYNKPQQETVVGERPKGVSSISGKVIAADTGQPLADARVYLFYLETHAAIFVNSATDGGYEFANIPPGKYSLRTSHVKGFQDTVYNPEHSSGSFPEFALADGEHKSNIVLKPEPAYSITGTVFNENNSPLKDSSLTVLAWVELDSKEGNLNKFKIVSQARIATDGTYHLDGLDNRPVYVMVLDFSAAKKDESYPPCYYPGTVARNEAVKVTFDTSSSVQDINIHLTEQGAFTLKGLVTDEQTGKPIPNTLITVHHRDMLFDRVTAYTDRNGNYQMDCFGAGDFQIHVDAEPWGYVRTRKPIAITTEKTNTLDFTLRPAAKISGRIVDTEGHPVQISARTYGLAYRAGYATPETMSWSGVQNKYSAEVRTHGNTFNGGQGDYEEEYMGFPTPDTFVIEGMMPGETMLRFHPKSQNTIVKAIMHNGTDIKDTGLTTVDGEHIEDIIIVLGSPYTTAHQASAATPISIMMGGGSMMGEATEVFDGGMGMAPGMNIRTRGKMAYGQSHSSAETQPDAQKIFDTPVDCSSWTAETPIEEAIDTIRKAVDPGIQIVVLWANLSENAVEKDTPIGLDGLGTVELQTALDVLLKSVSHAVLAEIGYQLHGRVVIISGIQPTTDTDSSTSPETSSSGGDMGGGEGMGPGGGMGGFGNMSTSVSAPPTRTDTLLLGPNGTGYFDRDAVIQIDSIVIKVARRIEAKNIGTDIVEITSDKTEGKLSLGLGGTGYFDRNAAIQISDASIRVRQRIEVANTGTGTIEVISIKEQTEANQERKPGQEADSLPDGGGLWYFPEGREIGESTGGFGGAPKSDPPGQIIYPRNWDEIARSQGEDPNQLPADFNSLSGMQIEIYDFADLLAASFDQGYQPGQAGFNKIAERLIKELEAIVPESWRSNGGQGQVNVHGTTKLLIWQTPDVHEKIADYLVQRRRQVAIEARFILADELFEKRIGIDENAERYGQVIEGFANSDEINAAMETKPLTERNLPVIEHKPLKKIDSKTEQSIIRAAQQFKNTKQLTAPKAVVLNTESASMRVAKTHSYVDASNETKGVEAGLVLDVLPTVQDDDKTILLKTHIQMTDFLDQRTQVIDGKEYSIPWVQVTTIPFQTEVESGGTIFVEGPEVSDKNKQTGEVEKRRLFVLLKPTALPTPEDGQIPD